MHIDQDSPAGVVETETGETELLGDVEDAMIAVEGRGGGEGGKTDNTHSYIYFPNNKSNHRAPSLDGVGVCTENTISPGSVGGCGCGAVEDGEL